MLVIPAMIMAQALIYAQVIASSTPSFVYYAI